MQLSNIDLSKILVEQNYLSQEESKDVLKEADERRADLRTILFERRLLTADLLENALAEYYKLPFYDLIGKAPTIEIVQALPEECPRTFSVIDRKSVV